MAGAAGGGAGAGAGVRAGAGAGVRAGASGGTSRASRASSASRALCASPEMSRDRDAAAASRAAKQTNLSPLGQASSVLEAVFSGRLSLLGGSGTCSGATGPGAAEQARTRFSDGVGGATRGESTASDNVWLDGVELDATSNTVSC